LASGSRAEGAFITAVRDDGKLVWVVVMFDSPISVVWTGWVKVGVGVGDMMD
jgi:hypothetical protein